MKKILKTIFLSIIISNITFVTYANNECKIKNFEFNDIFDKNPELEYNNIYNKIIYSKFNRYESKIDVNAEPIYLKGISSGKVNKEDWKKSREQYNYTVDILTYLSNCRIDDALKNYNKSIELLKYAYEDQYIQDFMNLRYDFLFIYLNFLNGNFKIAIDKIDYNLNMIKFKFLNLEIDNVDIIEYQNMYNDFMFLKNYIAKFKNIKSSDEYSGEQYYLNKLNVVEAWKNKNYGCTEYLSNGECKTKYSGKDNVIVAVIDDGININHLDITNKIWVNNKEIPGNKIDDDKNGYIDDFNGWNFYKNDNNTIPMGNHGTAVAGVIGAEANNGIGIAGIVSNAKIMSLGVFSESGTTKTDDILKAINYAIDNNVDLINLSLEGSQFAFSQSFNSIFKKAYEKNIPIIVSAGNGDTLSSGENGVNTSINKLSPVCNDYGNKKIVMGVGSLQEDGNKSKWSNYGDCVDFWSYGENIFSLSILDEESEYGKEYNKFNGTSFSAPILTGIIGLGINKVGNVSPSIIYDALSKSESGNIINANSFINNLIYLSDESIKNKKILEKLKKFQEINMQRKEEINKKIENEIYYNKIKYSVIVLILIFIISIGWVIIYKKKFKT